MEVAPILVNPGQTNKANKIFGCHRLGHLEATRVKDVKDVKGKVATQQTSVKAEAFHEISGMAKWQPVLKPPLPKGRKGRMVDPKAPNLT